jgi:hypothetical protein
MALIGLNHRWMGNKNFLFFFRTPLRARAYSHDSYTKHGLNFI